MEKIKTLPDQGVPEILHISGEECDPNFQDVPLRDLPKHLRERYWVKQWSSSDRLPNHGFGISGKTELRQANLGRKLDRPGDAFFDLILSDLKFTLHARVWIEVTEVFLPDQAPKVNELIRQYNGLPGKGKIDTASFLQSLDLGPPDSRLQREMADQVILAIKGKARKGRKGGSYRPLVHDYGRGTLVVGLPLWFATLPPNPTDPSTVLTDFVTRLQFGFKTIERSVLRKRWCPFDSVVVFWNPSLESIASWVKAADLDFYSDPANLRWHSPISILKTQSSITAPNLPSPKSIRYHVRWNRYPSLKAMIADQYRRIRFFNKPRPFDRKACLDVINEGVPYRLRITCCTWFLHLWFFVRLHGWRGLHRWILARISIGRLYSRWRLTYRARKLYRSS